MIAARKVMNKKAITEPRTIFQCNNSAAMNIIPTNAPTPTITNKTIVTTKNQILRKSCIIFLI